MNTRAKKTTRVKVTLRRWVLGLLLVQAWVVPNACFGQPYPAKPIRMVMPYLASTAPDLLARVFSPALGTSLGQPIVLENIVGASGISGTERVARSPADGYTVMFATTGSMVSVVFLNKNVSYDPIRDFTPIGPALEPVTLLLGRTGLPANNLQGLIAYAKQNPDKLSIGSTGIGSEFHLSIEAMNRAAGIKLLHVPYKGTVQAMQDAMGGSLDLTFGTISSTRAYRDSGKLVALALSSASAERYAGLPDIPAMKEVLPKFVRSRSFFAFWGPLGVPEPIVARLNAELLKVLGLPDVRAWLAENGLPIVARTPNELRELHQESFESYRDVVKLVGIQPQ